MRCSNECRSGLADHIDHSMVADPILGYGKEVLGFIRDKKEEIAALTLLLGQSVASQDVYKEKQLEQRSHVSALRLKSLRQRQADNLAMIHVTHGERAVPAENFSNLGCDKMVQVVSNTAHNARKLVRCLGEIFLKMPRQVAPLLVPFQCADRFLQFIQVCQQVVGIFESYRVIQSVKGSQGLGDVDLGSGPEE